MFETLTTVDNTVIKLQEKKLFEVVSRAGKKNVSLLVNSKFQLIIERDSLQFISKSISVFSFAGYLQAAVVGCIKRDQNLRDRFAIYKKLPNITNQKGSIDIFRGIKSSDPLQFNVPHYPVKIVCKADSENLYIKYRLSCVDVFTFIGQLQKCKCPSVFYAINDLNIIRNTTNIELKIGGSNSVYLTNENLDIFLYNLNHWISGQYLIDIQKIKANNNNNNKEKPYYTTRYNRDGLGFNGMPIPMINIHGLSCKLSYIEIAELYFVIKCMANYIAKEGVSNT